jgi:hypothetical protein
MTEMSTSSSVPGAALAAAYARFRARWSGFYALGIYLPISMAARRLRDRGRAVRGVRKADTHATGLPHVPWSAVLRRRTIHLGETDKSDGNVNLAELAILAQAAAAIPAGTMIVEIGTFDGRTTLNLAINAAGDAAVVTLDLPPDDVALYALAPGERQYVDKPRPGERFRVCGPPWQAAAGRITQLHGDSATFDWAPYEGRAGLVFVDGSHAYDYVRKDSETAMRLVAPDGMVLWHDYGRWEGVSRALDELEAERGFGLRQISWTSLVFWRAPGR